MGVTANEEELRPSSLRPRYEVLSPSEWSKVLLTKILAQAIVDNDHSSSANNHVQNSLLGTVLLLDDITAQSSEVEESRLFKELRVTVQLQSLLRIVGHR